jgi:tRNA(fMet)-specific endonuclease VapC
LNLLFDTNILSKMIRGREPSYRLGAAKSIADGNRHHTSVIVYFELQFGANNSPTPHSSRAKLEKAMSLIAEIHNWNMQDAAIAANLRIYLARRGEPIGEYDLLIAAQALRLNFPLVTNNVKHFNRIPTLKVLDWA